VKLGLIKDFLQRLSSTAAQSICPQCCLISRHFPFEYDDSTHRRLLKYKEVVTRAACELMPQRSSGSAARPSPRPGKLVCAQLSFREAFRCGRRVRILSQVTVQCDWTR